MYKAASIMTAVLLLAAFGASGAQELSFPQTEQQIVDTLSFKDGVTVYQGDTYVSKGGRVYKVIEGKRYRLRGLQVIPADNLLPKAAALIQFDFDSAEVKPDSYRLLDQFGKAFGDRLAEAKICITGHTDNSGEMDYNQALSEKRANAVANYLIDRHHISQMRIIAIGAGETAPIASNETEGGRAKNRRVEFLRLE